jgi:hypothetical protein
MKRKIGNWRIIRNNKEEFDIWNNETKTGYYTILKSDGYWVVREYSDKLFGAIDLTNFNNKENAINFILNKVKEVKQ